MTDQENGSADAAAVASCDATEAAQATLQPTSPKQPSGKPGAQPSSSPHAQPWGGTGGLLPNSVTIHQTGLVRRGKRMRVHGH